VPELSAPAEPHREAGDVPSFPTTAAQGLALSHALGSVLFPGGLCQGFEQKHSLYSRPLEDYGFGNRK